jgi:hypothetical protein
LHGVVSRFVAVAPKFILVSIFQALTGKIRQI